MVIYIITFIPVVEELWASDMALLVNFYEDDAKFDGYIWRSAYLLKLLLYIGPERG